MHNLRIADLDPALTAPESKQFRASVILVWPYSSSQRQFALLLAEPDFRLRRKKGQVRARFTESSAKAIASAGIRIGDEVVLSLQGVNFVKQGMVQTPGRSIDWELEYTQSIVAQVFRNGSQIANLEIVNSAPTPAPCSPSHWVSFAGPTSNQQWSSPTVLKRSRNSDGPFFAALYDPFVEDAVQGYSKKRRRKSYRDHWKKWTYSTRTPSPEKEGAEDEDLEDIKDDRTPPIRDQQRLHMPVSPSNSEMPIAIEDQPDKPKTEEEQSFALKGNLRVERAADDQTSIHPENTTESLGPYVGLDTILPENLRHEFGPDLEIRAEQNTKEEDIVQGQPHSASVATTGINIKPDENSQSMGVSSDVLKTDVAMPLDASAASVERSTGKPQPKIVQSEAETAQTMTDSSKCIIRGVPTTGLLGMPRVNMRIEMPPPTIPTLHIEDTAPAISDLLTPPSREPSSPALKPLDSATLPLPSPFPGDIDSNKTSFSDYFTANLGSVVPETAVDEEPKLSMDVEYIMETSFFSSVGSSRAPALHPSHESAFTPVRFTFGLDGAGVSRPLNLSSPTPDDAEVQETLQLGLEESIAHKDETRVASIVQASSPPHLPTSNEEAQSETTENFEISALDVEESPNPNEIDVSFGSGTDKSNESKSDDEIDRNRTDREIRQVDNRPDDASTALVGGQHNDSYSGIVDLGSPLSDDSEEADHESRPLFMNVDEAPVERDIFMTQSSFSTLRETENMAYQSQEQTTIDTPPQYALGRPHEPNVRSPLPLSGTELQTARDESENYMHDALMFNEASSYADSLSHDEHINYPNIKMESVEDESIFERFTQLVREDSTPTPTEPLEELVIAVPEAGGKMGELHTVAVPATGPARNTRSKLSITVSPTRNQKHTPRNTRSSARSVSVARETLSPVVPRTKASFPTPPGPSQVSPYSLRSQTKLLSPLKDSFGSAAVANHPASQRKAPKKNENPLDERASSPTCNFPVDMDIFESQYNPSASQGRFSNCTYVRDSEEDSVRSEHSLSTVYYTDSSFGIFSDPIQPTGPTEVLRPPPASAPEPKTVYHRNATAHVPPPALKSSSTSRPPSSASSPAASAKAQGGRRAIHVDHLSLSDEETGQTDQSESQRTPRGIKDLEGFMSDEGEHKENHNQCDSQMHRHADLDKYITSSPPAIINSLLPSQNPHTDVNKHHMITPEDTQHSTAYSNPNFTASQGNSLPITPELTQASSTCLISFPANNGMKTAKTPIDDYSSNASSETATPKPSIGLSTPLAYYTPLRDLSFFLNRSSQYHSTENPDILALVTSDSTPPTRAKKGPRHYSTNMHITDLSIFPHTTTVNIFRPYESALPIAHKGDVMLLRAFAVKSAKRQAGLISAEDSAWCVWRWGKPCWGMRKGSFGEVRAREEVRGPEVERGEGEWREVETLREWYTDVVEEKLRGAVGKKEGIEESQGSSQALMGDQGNGGNIGEGDNGKDVMEQS